MIEPKINVPEIGTAHLAVQNMVLVDVKILIMAVFCEACFIFVLEGSIPSRHVQYPIIHHPLHPWDRGIFLTIQEKLSDKI